MDRYRNPLKERGCTQLLSCQKRRLLPAHDKHARHRTAVNGGARVVHDGLHDVLSITTTTRRYNTRHPPRLRVDLEGRDRAGGAGERLETSCHTTRTRPPSHSVHDAVEIAGLFVGVRRRGVVGLRAERPRRGRRVVAPEVVERSVGGGRRTAVEKQGVVVEKERAIPSGARDRMIE